jgi:hypothetical protein
MSVFKMGILTILIAMGACGYSYCNWPQGKMRLNDYKDDHAPGTIKLDERDWETCRYCGDLRMRVGVCYNESCPSNR